MQNTYTSVLARRVRISDDYRTLPYEGGWATEALFFVQTEGDHPPLDLAIEVSPDGINWVQRDTTISLGSETSIVELPVAHFGSWLRLAVLGATVEQPARVLVHLSLKG